MLFYNSESVPSLKYETVMGCAIVPAHCHSMNEELRGIAVAACKHLAKQCSDPDAVNRLVKYFFKVLGGE